MKLQLIAFGPYLNETIDFTSFYKNSIFLIAGKTGAGKTTIFDAMSYALFGYTNGLNREPKEMRSTFAGPTDETKVVFTFSAQNKIYQIERIPEQTLAKKRGDGERVVKAKATITIFDQEWQELNHFSKTTEVNQVVHEVVQLEDEQFRQIIMLPQGDFRRFLNANSNEKEKILRKLFGTEPYRVFSEKLKEQKKQVALQIKDQEKELVTTLNHAQWQNELPEIVETGQARIQKELEWLIEQQEVKTKELATLKVTFATITQAEKLADQELQEKKAVGELFNEQEELKNQQAVLFLNLSKIQELKVKIRQVREAEKMQPNLIREVELVNEQSSYEKELDNLQKEAGNQSETLKEWESLLIEKTKEQAQQRQRETQLIQLNQQKKLIEEYQICQKQENQLTEKVNEFEKHKAEIQETVASFQSKMTNLEQQLVSQKEISNEINQLKVQQITSQASQKIVLDLLELDNQLQQTMNQLEQIQESIQEKQSALLTGEKVYKKIKSKWARIQILRLSEDLEDGMPCPVCGSIEHPLTHQTQVETTDLDKNEAKSASQLEKELEVAEADLTILREELAGLKSQQVFLIKQKDIQQDSRNKQESQWLENQIIQTLTVTSLPEQQATLTAKLETIGSQLLTLQHQKISESDLQHQLLEVKTNYERTIEEFDSVTNHLKIIWQQQLETKGKLTQFKQQIPEELLENGVFVTKIQQLEEAIVSWSKEFQKIESTKLVLEDQLKKNEYHQQHVLAQLNKNQIQLKQLKQKIQDRIHQSSFSTLVEVEEALAQLDEAVVWEAEIAQFELEDYRLTQRLSELAQRLGQQEKPDLVPLVEKLTELQQKKEVMQRDLITNEQVLSQNSQVVEEATAITASIQDQWQLLTEITTLSAVASGDSDQSKMGFERYVLTYFLEEVLIVANERLQQLSNNRYLFDLNRQEGSRKTDTGLEINIYDDNAGGIRNVRTLSGGESFIAALSLSLSLSEVVQQYAGGIQIETMFIDEGFGSLDEDALEEAMDALLQIEGTGRLLGIISHVKELKERIPDKLLVVSSGTGKSQIKISHLD